MKPYNETNSNPFLCDDCQPLGYCIKNREAAIESLLPKYYKVLSDPNPDYDYMKDADIVNLVPVKAMVKDYYTPSGKKLQQAHDLFHQNEYEQASYLYRDLLTQRADYDEAAIGLAACYYFMKQYEEAAAIVTGFSRFSIDNKIAQFLEACARATHHSEKNKKEILIPKCYFEQE
jgi:tetratricopeptide (TPR) repeat protein